MKRLLLLLLLLLTVYNINYAQQFELTPNGFVNSENKEIEYIVLEYSGKTKEELFKEVLIFATENFKSSKEVVSKVEYETITINANSSKLIRRNTLHAFNNNYTVVMSFKDGKVKMNAPVVDLSTFTDGRKQTLHVFYPKTDLRGTDLSVYNKKGVARSKMAVSDLNAFALDFLELFKSEMQKDNEW